MKYLVIKDCPGFKVGDVVDPIPSPVYHQEDRVCGKGLLNQSMPLYTVKDHPDYFQPMWFNFGDKIRNKKWDTDRFFIPQMARSSSTPNYIRFDGISSVKNDSGLEYDCLDQSKWEFYQEPKKKNIVRMAPALCKLYGRSWITTELFKTLEHAKSQMGFIKWPANDNMWVEVEE